MKIKDALIAKLPIRLRDDTIKVIMSERDLSCIDDFDKAVADSKQFKGAFADCLTQLVLMPDVTEGGVSIKYSQRKELINLANSIYREIEEDEVQFNTPIVKFLGED